MTDTTLTAAPKRGLANLFTGTHGIRAGWGVAIFVLIAAALIFGLNVGLHAIHFHSPKDATGPGGPISSLFSTGVLASVLLVATLVTALIERRKLADLGLSLTNALPRFLQGLFFGVAALAALIGLLYVCGAIQISPIVLHGSDIWRFGGLWAAVFLLVGIGEELAFRTYLLQTIARGLNFRWACLIMAILFTAAHGFNPGETPIGLILVFVVAIVFALSVWRSGTIWWALGFHAAWDWAQSYLFGVADSGQPAIGSLVTSKAIGPDWLSGGATGPEGSILALVVLAAVTGVIFITLRKPDHDLGIKW